MYITTVLSVVPGVVIYARWWQCFPPDGDYAKCRKKFGMGCGYVSKT